jgi:hypothetical protein
LTVKALRTLYPDQQWGIALRPQKPIPYWKDIKNQRTFFDNAAKLLNIQKQEDWNSISLQDLSAIGGSFIQKYYNGSIADGTLLFYFPKRSQH